MTQKKDTLERLSPEHYEELLSAHGAFEEAQQAHRDAQKALNESEAQKALSQAQGRANEAQQQYATVVGYLKMKYAVRAENNDRILLDGTIRRNSALAAGAAEVSQDLSTARGVRAAARASRRNLG